MILMPFSIMYARDCTRFKEAYGTRRYANICLHEHDISPFQTSRRNNSHDLHADACLGFIAFSAIFSFRNFSKNIATFECKNTNTMDVKRDSSIIKLNDVNYFQLYSIQVFRIFISSFLIFLIKQRLSINK